jgi:hypothetical protein
LSDDAIISGLVAAELRPQASRGESFGWDRIFLLRAFFKMNERSPWKILLLNPNVNFAMIDDGETRGSSCVECRSRWSSGGDRFRTGGEKENTEG